MKERTLKIIFWVYTLFILYFSFSPQVIETPTSDKINHFVAFFVFSILVKEAYRTTYWGSFFYSLFFSVFIEVVQYFLPYRQAEYGDFSADLLGITSGLFMYFVIKLTYLELKHKE
ncbi:VanZ like family protein [Persephonella hydrogeniphila]|uniref:VanZ like family protein n=1 Tax=Persephonella hydrogeniphila TaxID=198703 RepID=A0A285NL65_9AQUI|nr:VanZ family protein [Persephonella hydrogeniphila]SNZ10274.1 VanZ like family protein [Persephonella hydrogeniphila]